MLMLGVVLGLAILVALARVLAQRTNHSTAAMCIDDPLQHHLGAMHHLFDTHPPIAKRIAVLERMAQGQTV